MSKPVLTFVIPVRHPENAKDWSLVKRNLIDTTRSIAGQSDSRWWGVVVANDGADLPALPDGFTVVRVGFPPNPLYDIGSADLEKVYDTFRLDKGRRVLAGLISARPSGHVMICDDDDFVNCALTAFVSNNQEKPGWFIQNGYVWAGGRMLYRSSDFSHLCGTSHIIRSDLYGIPETAEEMPEATIKRSLGSHMSIARDLSDAGFALDALPFPGAIYRTGHPGAHSRSLGLRQQYFPKALVLQPRQLADRLSRLSVLTPQMRRAFFG